MTKIPGDTWQLRKPAVRGDSGLVAAQHPGAAAVGAQVLRDGGNAVDAAIATAFALGVVEPWMSGIGGGGTMLIHRAGDARPISIDYPMPSPAGLDPATYPMTGGTDEGLFGWPLVAEGRNQQGFHSVGIPGAVAGFALARERYGRKSWAELLAPATAMAEQGLPCDWPTSMSITISARELARYPGSRAVYLADGLPPPPPVWGMPKHLPMGRLAATYKRLATAGPRDFYEGEIARGIVDDIAEGGGTLSAADLAGYKAREREPLIVSYRGIELALPPGLTGGPTAARAFALMAGGDTAGERPSPARFADYRRALLTAYRERFETMGHAGPGSCTTHLCVVDGEGTLVALTNTLLARFGSKVVLPRTGILMNNAIMWFDPRPGRPNSLAGGVLPLSNMCPLIALRDGKPWMAVGASGGRSIVPSVVQLTAMRLDHDMDLDAAFHEPRIDLVRGETVTCDAAMSAAAIAAVTALGPTEVREPAAYPTGWACPTAVENLAGGGRMGAADPRSPWAAVVRA